MIYFNKTDFNEGGGPQAPPKARQAELIQTMQGGGQSTFPDAASGSTFPASGNAFPDAARERIEFPQVTQLVFSEASEALERIQTTVQVI